MRAGSGRAAPPGRRRVTNGRAPLRGSALAAGALALALASATPARGVLGASIHLPALLSGAQLPAPPLEARLLQAASIADPSRWFPAYGDSAPSRAAALVNVEAACHDAPPLDAVFGLNTQAVACRVWVANALGNWHAVRHVGGQAPARGDRDVQWAAAYLDLALEGHARLAYAKGEGPDATGGLRDTLGAVWQNTARLVDVIVVADDLARAGALSPDVDARVSEVASAVVRAWRSAWWEAGTTPGTGLRLTTRTADQAPARSLAGAPVAFTTPFAFAWDADRGNTPAEEMAWMAAGVLLASRWLEGALPPDEHAQLAAAGAHYAAFALSAGRRDPRTGARVWTLGREASGGAYGQNALWLENHQPDVPSIPYLGVTWFYLAVAELAWPEGRPRPWQPDGPVDPWPAMRDGALATIRAPDGRLLLDIAASRPVDYAMAPFPAWTMPCGTHRAGALYVATGLEAPVGPRFVNEIGEPAGVALLAAAVPIAKAAEARGDQAAAARWSALAHRALDDMDDEPVSLAGLGCKVSPWTAANPLNHRASIASQLASLWRVASDRTVLGPGTGDRLSRRHDVR